MTNVWFHNLDSVGDERLGVEIFNARLKHKRGYFRKQLQLFGGNERLTKCMFVIPLNSTGEKNK